MDGFIRRKEQSKEEIRNAASELFSKYGVDKVSITDIAKKAGVSQATIYNNFGSKDNLVREFASTAIEKLILGVQSTLLPGMTYTEKMNNIITYIENIITQSTLGGGNNPLFRNNSDLLIDPEISKIYMAAQEKMIELLLNLIEEGKESGNVNEDLSEEALIIYFSVFMKLFIDPHFQYRFQRNPGLVQELGKVMVTGISKMNE